MGSLERLNFMKQQYNLPMIILQEPMVGPEKIDVFRRKLGYNYCFKNINNKIWIFWSDQVNVNLVQNKEQQVLCKISSQNSLTDFYLTIVYAKCTK